MPKSNPSLWPFSSPVCGKLDLDQQCPTEIYGEPYL